jgi:hypothetical protein
MGLPAGCSLRLAQGSKSGEIGQNRALFCSCIVAVIRAQVKRVNREDAKGAKWIGLLLIAAAYVPKGYGMWTSARIFLWTPVGGELNGEVVWGTVHRIELQVVFYRGGRGDRGDESSRVNHVQESITERGFIYI